jgi:hypothetical protein
MDHLLRGGDTPEGRVRRRSERFAGACLGIPGRGIVHGHCAEGICVAEVHCPELGLADAHRLRQHGLEYRLQLARRTADDLQHLRGRRQQRQRLGERLLQLSVACTKAGNVITRVSSGRTNIGNARSALLPFVRQGHLVRTVAGPLAFGSRQGLLSILTEPHDDRTVTLSPRRRGRAATAEFRD